MDLGLSQLFPHLKQPGAVSRHGERWPRVGDRAPLVTKSKASEVCGWTWA